MPKFPPEEADREKKRREEKVSTHGKLDFLPAFSSQSDFYHRQKGKLLYLDFTLINMQGTSAIKSSFTVLDRKGHVPFTSSLLKNILAQREQVICPKSRVIRIDGAELEIS